MKKYLVIIFVFSAFFMAVDSFAQNPNKSIVAAQFYEGGQEAMYKFIDANKIYPPNAKRARSQGECIIHVVIEADGRVSSTSVVTNIGGGCGDEAHRLVKLLKFKAPGYRLDTNIPVYFKL